MIQPSISVHANYSYQQIDALYLTHLDWILDSVNPGASPVVTRQFQYNPEAQGFADDMQAEGFRLVYNSLSAQAYLHDTKKLTINRSDSVTHVKGRSQDDVVALYDRLKTKYGRETILNNPLMLLVQNGDAYSLTQLSTPAEKLVTENYMPPVVEKFEYLARQIVADKPKGRIGILSGYPGTGKTFLIRALLDRYVKDTHFILINTDQCLALGSNIHKFMQMLANYSTGKKKTVLIMEDADSAIAPRSTQNLSTIQNILNFGDGLMGDALDLRILVSTNVRTVDIDPAILRPGRLIQHIDVPSLEPSFANALYKRLTSKDSNYKKPVTVAQVYQDVGVLEEAAQALAAE